HRVNAGEGGVVMFPGIFGSPIDPSTLMEDRDVAQLGTGLWNRMLIDATRSWKHARRPRWGGARFLPPHPAPLCRRPRARAGALVGVRARRPVTRETRVTIKQVETRRCGVK